MDDWIYSLLPTWAADVPHWALAVAVAGGVIVTPAAIAGGITLWRWWGARLSASDARASRARDDLDATHIRRVDRLSDRYAQLDRRIDEGFTALHGVILASEQRHNDHMEAVVTRIREQQHDDLAQVRAANSNQAEALRQDMQKFHGRLMEAMIKLSGTQQNNITRIDQAEQRLTDHERRILAVEIEQRSMAKAVNGRATTTDHLPGRGD